MRRGRREAGEADGDRIGSGAMARHRGTVLAALVGAALAVAPPARAQQSMTLGDFVLLWASGPYASPAICQLPGGPRRVARNLEIKPPRRSRPRDRHRLVIKPIGMQDARCTNELGREEPEIEGSLQLSFTGPKRPDTARRDFEHQLRRDGGFRLDVESGFLRVGYGEDQQRVDFEDGSLEIRRVPPGSDAARMLGEVGGLPTRTLELTAPDGTRFVFHSVHIVPPAPPSR
jgi:hypothetical protein